MPYSPSLADAAAVVVIVYLAKRFLSRANTISSLPLPPGPPGLPLIGNALDIPQTEPHKVYVEWAQKYGPIMHVSVLSQPLIIVNDLVIATELLVRHATNSSERPTLTMAGRLSGWNSLAGLMPYGAEWRTRRRHLNTAIGAHTIKSRHSALLGRAAQQMVLRLMRAPNKLDESVRALAGGVILKITYGYEAQEEHDPLVELVGGAMNYFNRLTESNQVWMVDLFPILRHVPAWLPGAGFQRTASESMKMAQKMAQVPFDTVTAQMRDGKNASCMVTDLLANSTSADDETSIQWSAATAYAGGTDTAYSTLMTLFLCLTLYPAVQKKAQEELDAVVGRARLPTLADRTKLPYINAIVSEVFRWRPVGPMGFPHKLTQDEIYDGYCIPAGALVVSNIWAMLHDPAVYANPDVFEPERFLAKDDKPAEPDPRSSVFGFGRRVCAGQALADASVWTTTAVVLATLSVTKTRDDFGAEITPEGRYTGGSTTHPEPFQCDINPRFAGAEALVSQELEQYKLGCN